MLKFAQILGVLAVVTATLAVPAVAADPKKIAVRAFTAKGLDASTAGILETSFCTALGDEKLDVLCPDEVKALIGHQQTQLGTGSDACANEDDCLKATAKATEAGRVVTGDVSKLGEKIILTVTLIDADTGKVLARGSETTAKAEDMLDKLPALAKKIASAK